MAIGATNLWLVRRTVERIAGRIGDPVVRLRFLNAAAPPPKLSEPGKGRRRLRWIGSGVVIAVVVVVFMFKVPEGKGSIPHTAARPVQAAAPHWIAAPPNVWLVERKGTAEVYSNGLRVDISFTVGNHPRTYVAFRRDRAGRETAVRSSVPVGIVFHTTESRQVPFEADENGVLKRIGESLLEYVRKKHAYHYLIDRFGRVYRLVAEEHSANHAGNSVWGDEEWLYINLNESFLGVSFEAETHQGQTGGGFSAAQARSGAMLLEMLRTKYKIKAENCLTHAQVSVNPKNMRMGYHTDWASGFPFQQMGLPDNYALGPAALWAFGFESDPSYLRNVGSRLYPALSAAEERLEQAATESGQRLTVYRKGLQKRYRERLAEVRREAKQDVAVDGN